MYPGEYWMIYRGPGFLSARMIWLLPHLLPPLSSVSSAGDIQEDWEREIDCWWEREEWRGKEPNHTPARKRSILSACTYAAAVGSICWRTTVLNQDNCVGTRVSGSSSWAFKTGRPALSDPYRQGITITLFRLAKNLWFQKSHKEMITIHGKFIRFSSWNAWSEFK